MPTDLAAFWALRKSRQAMMTCHLPLSARALAVARPRPDEAPVIITVPFRKVFLPWKDVGVIVGDVATARVRTEALTLSESEIPKRFDSFRDAPHFACRD
ncbi:trigger factor [Striga asiatica]|uniref:Trigger factor n=1 Tax=Striga asiatica TaxID=4170 RepID=A0A5A7R849_STRAF|nr:trigger factor [Striga asiatica]